MPSESGPGSGEARGLERIYEQAVSLPETERDAFLDEACGDDAELRAELASLLAEGQGAETFLDDLGRLVEPTADGTPEPLVNALALRYRIEGPVGAGGMATVYVADDVKHSRKVAIKVLKPELAAVVGAERFLAEIQTTASLQHPHILPLHDSGKADGLLFYVMPYVRGESLRARLAREHQLPIDDAIRIATHLAEALDYAHRQGVIHRDLKPANVLLQDGEPVISDFGIALAVGAAGSGRLTEPGMSLGTPHYMSPEQVTGDRTVGPATDIYALGCVLYEMLVGEPPFTGSTPQAVLGRIMSGETPSPKAERSSVPPNVDAVIAKSLEKLPADRFQSARSFGRALGDPGFRHREGPRDSKSERNWQRVAVAGWLLAGLASVTAGLMFVDGDDGLPGPAVTRLSIDLPIEAPISFSPGPLGLVRPALALSPTGDAVAYVGETPDGDTNLFIRQLDSFNVEPLPGTEGAFSPFFSPDGRWVAFFTTSELKKVSVDGGQVVSVAEVSDPYGGIWTAEDDIYVSVGPALGILRFDVEGSDEPEPMPVRGMWPDLIPGTNTLVLSDRGMVYLGDLESGAQTRIADGHSGRWIPTGHVAFVRGNELWAVRFDRRSLRTEGTPFPMVAAIRHEAGGRGGAQYAVSSDGTLLYAPGPDLNETRFAWADSTGSTELLPFPSAHHEQFDLSPDETEVAVEIAGDIWIYDLTRGVRRRLTSDGASESPFWSPDGRWIGITCCPGAPGIYRMLAGGTGEKELVYKAQTATAIWYGGWNEDMSLLAFGRRVGTEVDLAVLDIASDRVDLAATTPARGGWPRLSPDGRWLAYTSMESGTEHVYVEPYPPTGERWQISAEGGSEEPRWSGDGNVLVFRTGRRLLATVIQTSPSFGASTPRTVLEGDFVNVPGWSWDMSADGRRFLVLQVPEAPETGQTLQVVLDFSREVEARTQGR